jgi:hypothetical protein
MTRPKNRQAPLDDEPVTDEDSAMDRALRQAPLDNEPVTDEDRVMLAEATEDVREGRVLTTDQLLAELSP